MPTYLSPGIYTRETDFSFYVKQISTSSAAMVGVAEKGPINKPVLVTSWEQFINRFGIFGCTVQTVTPCGLGRIFHSQQQPASLRIGESTGCFQRLAYHLARYAFGFETT